MNGAMKVRLSGGRDVVVAVGRTRRTGAAARPRRGLIRSVVGHHRTGPVGTNRRRKHVERERVILAAVQPVAARRAVFVLVGRGLIVAIVTVAVARTAVAAAVRAVTAILTLAALGAIIPRILGLGGLDQLFLALILVGFAARALLFEARPVLIDDAEIMVRILQIIFGLDAVARELRIARHALVLFEQLGGVAALAVVLSIPRLAAEVRSPLSSTAAPAAALTIIDQNSLP